MKVKNSSWLIKFVQLTAQISECGSSAVIGSVGRYDVKSSGNSIGSRQALNLLELVGARNSLTKNTSASTRVDLLNRLAFSVKPNLLQYLNIEYLCAMYTLQIEHILISQYR